VKALTLALSPRWLGYLTLAISFALVSAVFGLWQWDRREQAVTEITHIQNNFDQAPQAIGDVLPASATWHDGLRWLPVTLEGEYVANEQLLVRTRPRGGQVGFNVLVPLETSSGKVFIVDRGWVPTGDTRDEPDVIPAPPTGPVTVVVRLFPSEPEIPGRGAPEGQVPSVALGVIDRMLDHTADTRAYGQLLTENPAPSSRPLPALTPVPDEGPHLSYSIQWFVFAALGFVAWVYLFIQEYRYGPAERSRKPARKRGDDEEFEDAVFDRLEAR
jgi:cytochrome oxidase assembly protein ShyY1